MLLGLSTSLLAQEARIGNPGKSLNFFIIGKDYNLSEAIADKVYTSLLPALSEDGTATEKGLRVMVETLGVALKKEVNIPTSRLVDHGLLREVQRELALPKGAR